MEIWKKILGFNGLYEISNQGRVKSFNSSKFHPKPLEGVILKPIGPVKKYLRVNLYYNQEQKQCLIHRLVALAFVPNPDNLPEVNHEDGDKANNNDWNLKWCDNIYNIEHSFENDLVSNKRKPVMRLSKFGEFLEEYSSINEASRKLKIHTESISACLNKRRPSAGGFIWKFKN